MKESKTVNQVIEMISEILMQSDGEYIQEIANQILIENVEYIGDSMFEVKQLPE